jgi:hypothetical protein
MGGAGNDSGSSSPATRIGCGPHGRGTRGLESPPAVFQNDLAFKCARRPVTGASGSATEIQKARPNLGTPAVRRDVDHRLQDLVHEDGTPGGGIATRLRKQASYVARRFIEVVAVRPNQVFGGVVGFRSVETALGILAIADLVDGAPSVSIVFSGLLGSFRKIDLLRSVAVPRGGRAGGDRFSLWQERSLENRGEYLRGL